MDDGFEKQSAMISNAFLHEREHTNKQFAGSDKRLDKAVEKLEGRIDGVETRLGGIETRLERVETRLDRVETKVDRALHREYVHVDARVSYLEDKTGFKKPR